MARSDRTIKEQELAPILATPVLPHCATLACCALFEMAARMEAELATSRKTVGVVIKRKSATSVSGETLRGTKGTVIRVMTKDSYQKASEAANTSLRTSIVRQKAR